MMKSIAIGCLFSALMVADVSPSYRNKVNNFFVRHKSEISSVKPGLNFTYQLERDAGFAWREARAIDFGKYRAEVAFYAYTDSTSCAVALNKLLEHFPTEGTAIKKNENHDAFKIIPSMVVIAHKEISALSAPCESDTVKFAALKKDFLATFSDSTTKVIECGCGGPLEWK